VVNDWFFIGEPSYPDDPAAGGLEQAVEPGGLPQRVVDAVFAAKVLDLQALRRTETFAKENGVDAPRRIAEQFEHRLQA